MVTRHSKQIPIPQSGPRDSPVTERRNDVAPDSITAVDTMLPAGTVTGEPLTAKVIASSMQGLLLGPRREFDPDRWATRRPKHAFLPFGTGARACIGRQLALHEAVLVLGTVLRRYNLKPRPDYRLDVRELLSLKPEGLTLTPVRR